MAANRKRTYQDEFLNYGFPRKKNNGTIKPQCVVCMKVRTSESFKKSQLNKHLDNLHSQLSSKPREFFANLEISVKRQRLNSNLFGTFDQRSALRARFEVAWLIARNKKPYTIGEDLVKPAAVKMADYLLDLDTRTVSWIVDPFKCEIAKIPQEPSGLAKAILELRSNTEANIQFES
ncbi:SCAN domain-containing protein 3-like [Diorhabda carinulata]|uniref:SCAN domain-containing protein 3-like n=1 Tax=Diorhabda carinulata TaxID=1163345 RepID=UPI0025A19120|nr:SCAN domain-containing protein 3-like [Diorhabda carinulata]